MNYQVSNPMVNCPQLKKKCTNNNIYKFNLMKLIKHIQEKKYESNNNSAIIKEIKIRSIEGCDERSSKKQRIIKERKKRKG